METTSRFPRRWFPHGNVGAPPPGVPISLIQPVVTGLGEVGKTLTASTGTWTNNPTSYTYQWYRNGTAIGGQTASTYTCVLADKNQTVSVTVVATNSVGNSLAVPNTAPGFGVYSSTISGALPTLILSDPVREINHVKQSPTSNIIAATRYNQFSNGIATEGISYLNTEIITINPATGVVTSIVPPVSTLNNSNPIWDPSAGAFIIYSSSNTSGTTSTNTGCRKYTLPGLGLTIGIGIGGIPLGSTTPSDTPFYFPTDLNVSDFDLNASGDLLMSGFVSGGNSALYIWDGTTRTKLTTPTIVKAGNPEGDFDPSFKPGSTSSSGTVACVRAVAPDPTGNNSVYNIAVITYGAGFVNTGETVIAPIGSTSAFWGVPRWSSDGLKIISALLDPQNPEICGLYTMNPDGSSPMLISLQAEQLYNTPSFPAGGGSSSTAPIIYSSQFFPAVQALPSISGTAQVGQLLTASGGNGTYQWYREGAAIGGATASTYTPVAADQACILQVLSTSPFPPGYPVFSAGTIPVLGTTVFYVSSSTGLDTNAGTIAAPFKTLSHVNGLNALSGGTSILFKRGDTWRNDGCATSSGAQLSPSSSGTAGNPIVFDAYGTGPNPIIDGSIDLSTTGAWSLISGNVWQSTHTFNGFGHANGLPNNAADDPGNLIWGITMAGGANVPPALVNAHYGVMAGTGTNNIWWASGQAGLTSTGQWNFNTSTNKIQVVCTSNPATGLPGVNGDLRGAIDTCSIYFNQQSNIIIQNFTLNYSGATAIDTGGAGGTCNNIIIRDMVVQWIGGGNISGNSNADSRYGDGYDIEGSAQNVLIERIWWHQIYDTGPGPQCGGGPHQDNIIVRNNVCSDCGAFFSSFFLGGVPTASGLYIHNNTVYCTANCWSNNPTQRPNGAENVYALTVDTINGSTVVQTNMAINNNIFAGISGVSPSPGFGIIGTSWASAPNPSNPYTASGISGAAWLDYNCWPQNPLSPTGAPAQDIALASGNYRMVDWVKGTNIGGAGTFTPALEVHGIFSQDPQFLSQPSLNFTPGYISPCRNTGNNLYSASLPVPSSAAAGVVWDFNKNPRYSSGNFTMGAFEYGSNAPAAGTGINLNVAINVGDIPVVEP